MCRRKRLAESMDWKKWQSTSIYYPPERDRKLASSRKDEGKKKGELNQLAAS